MTLDLDIVDPHHHLWDLRNSYPWLQSEPGEPGVHGEDAEIRRDYLVRDYLADAGDLRLVASVHVEAAPGDPVAEARWLQAVADEHGFPQGIVGGIALEEPDAVATLEQLAEIPNVRGVRHILNWHPNPALTYRDRNDLMTDPAWLSGFERLDGLGLSFDLQVYPAQLEEAARLAADHPSTPIILNHAGMPVDRDEAGMELWRRGLRLLAAQPNTTAKISGLGMVDHRWTVASLRPVVLDVIEAFGVERCMFASNFPVDRLYSTFGALYAAFDEITADLSGDERRALFSTTARKTYRLG